MSGSPAGRCGVIWACWGIFVPHALGHASPLPAEGVALAFSPYSQRFSPLLLQSNKIGQVE